MIPFDGQFAENIVLPLAEAAYDSTQPPANYTLNQTAFEILANPAHPRFARSDRGKRAHRPGDSGGSTRTGKHCRIV